MLNTKHLVLLAVALVFYNTITAQTSKEALKLYDRLSYKASIVHFEDMEDMDQISMEKIANSYRLNHDTKNTELWYAQVLKGTNNPIDYLYYAQALQSNGKYDKAKEYYLKYDEMLGGDAQDNRGQQLAAAIDRMNEWKHTNVIIKNEQAINSEKLEFSPTYYGNGVVFVSTNSLLQDETEKKKDKWMDDHFMTLYYSDILDGGTLDEPQEFSTNISSQFHEGPVAFSRNGERLFFTRNNYHKGKRRNNSNGVMKLKIYEAILEAGEWTDVKEVPFNTDEYEEAHPTISADGTSLYFASDRAGGYGGMDIYKSEFINGTWSAPINLGEKVNTAGNEVFPFIHDDGTLYYASNGLGGLGGLDIFSTQNTDETTWSAPENIGTPFNSAKDDFGLVMNVLGTEGYFASAREDGAGKDDIYSFSKPNQPATFQSLICAYDATTDKRLEGVEVEIIEKELTDCGTAEDLSLQLVESKTEAAYLLKLKEQVKTTCEEAPTIYHTDAKGEFKTLLFPDKSYELIARKDGYVVAQEVLSTNGRAAGGELLDFCIPMDVNKCMALDGYVSSKKYGKRIGEATITVVNLCTGEEVVLIADKEGNFNFPCLECDCEYVFKGSKKYFQDGMQSLSTMGDKCLKGRNIELNLKLDAADKAVVDAQLKGANVVAPTIIVPNNYTATPNAPMPYTSFENPDLATGAVIELKRIFYDFDQHYIREGASSELDRIVVLMQKYPSMIIELGSHTDARGSDRYNKKLAQRRADAAVKYIASKGVDTRRLIAKGYGEELPRNNCSNGVDCTEEAHQYNRRTEVKIVQFDKKNIGVKYIDNAPIKVDHAKLKNKNK